VRLLLRLLLPLTIIAGCRRLFRASLLLQPQQLSAPLRTQAASASCRLGLAAWRWSTDTSACIDCGWWHAQRLGQERLEQLPAAVRSRQHISITSSLHQQQCSTPLRWVAAAACVVAAGQAGTAGLLQLWLGNT
jgi:hypothetical protein